MCKLTSLQATLAALRSNPESVVRVFVDGMHEIVLESVLLKLGSQTYRRPTDSILIPCRSTFAQRGLY